MVETFSEYLSARSMPRERLATFSLLDELVATPWTFDVLWDVWPQLRITRAGWPALAEDLLAGESRDLLLRGSAVFDAVTIFEDVVGDVDQLVEERRLACRAAYLSLRPTLVRSGIGDPPQPIGALTEERYLTRLTYVAAMLRSAPVGPVTEVLRSAADGYERRGKLDGAQLCRQNARLLRLLTEEDVLPTGVVRGEEVPLELPLADAYTFLEFACQWWPVFAEALRGLLHRVFDGDAPPGHSDELADLTAVLAEAAPMRPGVGSTVAVLTVLRVTAGEPPGAIALLPAEWTQDAQTAVTEMHRRHGSTLPQLAPAYEYLIDVERRDRGLTELREGTDRQTLVPLAMLWAEINFKVRLRARNELSHEDFTALIESYADRVRYTPQIVESILTFGAMRLLTDPSYARALIEAAEIMAPLTGNDSVIAYVRDAQTVNSPTQSPPADLLDAAERFQSRGRVDLAAMALYNAAVRLARQDATAEAIAAAERGWALVQESRAGDYLLPGNVVFSPEELGLRFAQVLSDALGDLGDYATALSYADQALHAYQTRTTRIPADLADQVATIAAALLHRTVALHHHLGDPASADAAVARAKDWAEGHGLHADAVRALVLKSMIARENGADPSAVNDPLVTALASAERARRSYPFELDKVAITSNVFEPYLWLGEHYVDTGRGWEALAAFEGLRSRAMLDFLGLSRALSMPDTLDARTAHRGTEILEGIRSTVFPGEASQADWARIGTRDFWAHDLRGLDDWLGEITPAHHDYAAAVSGRAMDADAIRAWAGRADRPTAVVFWYLGHEYSYQSVLLAGTPGPPQPPVIQRLSTTIGWLDDAAGQVREAVGRRVNPSAELWAELGRRLLDPVREQLEEADVVYLCPSQSLQALPISALTLGDAPLNTRKEVSVVPTLSVLNALQMIDAGKASTAESAVFGPEFPTVAARIGQLLHTRPIEPDLSTGRVDVSRLLDAPIVHLLCHGYFDEENAWESGLVYPTGAEHAILSGYDIVRWRLQARLAVLQACDTRRQIVSPADDTFGLGRFLHIAGAPTILLSDWNVRADVSTVFMSAFYRDLATQSPGPIGGRGRGHAYRAAMRAVYVAAGAQHPFLWAPFALVGVAD